MPNTSADCDDATRRCAGLRTFNRVGCLALIALVLALPVIGYFEAVREAEADLAALRKRLTAKGILVPVDQLIPKVPKGERNAADLYGKAFASLSITTQESQKLYDLPQSSPERRRLLLEVVVRNQPCYDLIGRASLLEHCALPRNWADPYSAVTYPPGYTQMIAALCYRIEALEALGKPAAALDAVGVGFAVVGHFKAEPTVVAQLLAYIQQSRLVEALEGVLSRGSPTPSACRQLLRELDQIDNRAGYLRALKGEAVMFDVPVFEQLRLGDMSWRDLEGLGLPSGGTAGALNLRALKTFGPLLYAKDELHYLRFLDLYVTAMTAPYPEARRRMIAAAEVFDRAPARETLISRTLTSSDTDYTGGLLCDTRTALLRSAQVALASVAFEAKQGRYPKSLAELSADGWKLPRDPFGGGELRYRREKQGFVVWSLGPNMANDQAVEYDSASMSLADGPYDIVFRVKR